MELDTHGWKPEAKIISLSFCYGDSRLTEPQPNQLKAQACPENSDFSKPGRRVGCQDTKKHSAKLQSSMGEVRTRLCMGSMKRGYMTGRRPQKRGSCKSPRAFWVAALMAQTT